MKSYLIIFCVALLFACVSSYRNIYGNKKWFWRAPKCDEFNPSTVKHVNLDDIAGKYYPIRVKSPCRNRNAPPTLSGTVEWIYGRNAAIRSSRLKFNPTVCTIVLREYTPLGDKDGSKFNMTLEEDNFVVEWRLMYFDSEYVITWACFRKNKYGKCVDWASGLLRRTPDVNISDNDMKRLDRIVKKKTCKTITDDYEKRELQEECRSWSIPPSNKCKC